MRRKEALCAVIGGVAGAVLVMALGSFAPLVAQTEARDAAFGTITCREIRGINEWGVERVSLNTRVTGTGNVVILGDNRNSLCIWALLVQVFCCQGGR